jgi:hypothetical protein
MGSFISSARTKGQEDGAPNRIRTGAAALRARKFLLSSSDDVQSRSRGKPMKIGFRASFRLGSFEVVQRRTFLKLS